SWKGKPPAAVRLQQASDGGAVSAKIEQQGAYVRCRLHQHDEERIGVKDCDDRESLAELEDGGSEVASSTRIPELRHVRDGGGQERGDALGVHAIACGDTTGLTAYVDNRLDSLVSLYALSGTPVTQPSGYSIGARSAVRTEQVLSFDFAFDIDTAGRPVLLPTGALKLGQQSGVQTSSLAFDSIRIAPTTNYQRDSAVVIGDSSVDRAFRPAHMPDAHRPH